MVGFFHLFITHNKHNRGWGTSPGGGIGYPPQYSWASLVAQMVKNPPAMRGPGFDTWVGKIPWRKAWQSAPIFLPGESPWTEEPGRHSPWGCKESDTTK